MARRRPMAKRRRHEGCGRQSWPWPVSSSTRGRHARPGTAARQLHKLEKKLVAARKTESKRLAQLAAAEAGKGRRRSPNGPGRRGRDQVAPRPLARRWPGSAARGRWSGSAPGGRRRGQGGRRGATGAVKAAGGAARTSAPRRRPRRPPLAGEDTATEDGWATRSRPRRPPRRRRPATTARPRRPRRPRRSRHAGRRGRRRRRPRPAPGDGREARRRDRATTKPDGRQADHGQARPRSRRRAIRRPPAAAPDPRPATPGPAAPCRPTVGASADLGSNSVHLLVARAVVTAGAAGRRVGLPGLGSAVADRGCLGRDARPVCRRDLRPTSRPPRARARPITCSARNRSGVPPTAALVYEVDARDSARPPRPVTRGGGVPDHHRRHRGPAGHTRDAGGRRRRRQLGVLRGRSRPSAPRGRPPARVGAPDRPLRRP